MHIAHRRFSSAPANQRSQRSARLARRPIIISTIMIITWDPCSNNDVGLSGREVVKTRKRKPISKCTLSTRSLIFLRFLRIFLDHHSGEEILSWVIIGMEGRTKGLLKNMITKIILFHHALTCMANVFFLCVRDRAKRKRKLTKLNLTRGELCECI